MTQNLSQIDYVDLLSGLSDPDSTRRKAAEQLYESIPAKDRFSTLGTALCHKEIPQSVRVFAAVLLRRLIITDWKDIQSSIPTPQLLASCNELLNLLRNSLEETKEVRDKICQVISALAKCFVDETTKVSQWSEFVQFMFELFRSPEVKLRDAGFTIFANNSEVLGQVNGETAYLDQIILCLQENISCARQPGYYYVSVVSSACSLIIANSSSKDAIKRLSTMALPLTETLGESNPEIDEETKEEICQHLIEVAEVAPHIFRPAVARLMNICINIMTSASLESDLKFSALELAVSLIESAPNMVKKRAAGCLKPIVLRVLAFMSSVEEDPSWDSSCTNEKDEDDPDAIGGSALDRISNALGGKVLLPILMDELTDMLRRPEWQMRHAALMAFSSAGEGCRDQLLRMLDRVVNGVLTYLADPHPRVRHAACNAIGQMATDFTPDFENKFHAQVIPALCTLLIDYSNIRVQAHSACAMINFFEECPQEILATYLDPVTEHIQAALSNYMNEGMPKDEGKLFVVENIIVALSSVADSSGESFIKYYEKFMPCLKFIIKETTGIDSLRVMRGKAIECVSLIGMAVGKERFCTDASEIMQMLLATQTGALKLADDDPQLSYMMAAWARICRILGSDFQAYLPYVMEPVLRTAGLRVELALISDEDKESIENSNDWASVTVQGQNIGIRTAGLEDKATACSMLVCYARELKHGFVEYVEKAADILIPLLKFPFHEDIKSASAEALPYLLESLKPKGEQCVLALWDVMFTNLISAIDIETDSSVLNQLLESLGTSIEVVGPVSMNPQRHERLTAALNEKFKEHFDNLAEEFERRKDEDYEVESECSDDETDCLAGIASVIHSCFVVFKSDYLKHFQSHIEPVLKLSATDQSIPWSSRQTALCIWDDVIEYTGQHSIDYQKFYLPLLASGILDKSKEVRQAALYGVGQLAQQNGPAFMEYFQTIVPSIVQLINHPEARTDDFILATENGISAVARILKCCPQLANHEDLLKCWLGWLPIWEDEAEVPIVMDYLIQLIEQNNQIALGFNSSNLPQLVAIVAEVFARSVINTDTDVGVKLVNFLKQVHANPLVNSCLTALTEPQQRAVQEVITGS